MMWLKGCPKCQGDLFEEPAIGLHAVASRYVSCLQCGHVLTEHEEALLQTAKKPKAARPRVA
jgi:hypothetical protein